MAEPPALKSAASAAPPSLPIRFGLLCGLLLAEKIMLSIVVDARRARDAEGLGAFLHVAQHWGFRYSVTFLAAASLFVCVKAQQVKMPRAVIRSLPAVSLPWMLVHVLLFAALLPLSFHLFSSEVGTLTLAAMAVLWLFESTMAVFAASIGLIPVSIWLQGIRSLGVGWIYAATGALLGTSVWLESERLWNSVTAITFKMVTCILTPILPLLYVNPATRVIATQHFAVEISEVCSGLEGLGMTMSFTVVWLAYFRREYIFPRALILIPLSLVAIFFLNVLRIATLLLIGNAGSPEVASFGFHSQAGWIAFNAVACALAFFSRRSTWLNRTAISGDGATEAHNPTAIYLVPMLTILTAGSVSHALSGRFETWYPLRLIAAIPALLWFGRPLLAMSWRCTWRGPGVGVAVYLLWIVAAHWLLPESSEPGSLAAMLPLPRALWIAGHFLTSVMFVPIAEELAYRGYLMRRLVRPDFESVPYRSVRWLALSVTAVGFGAAHGSMWAPGIAAGLAYGVLVIRQNSLGEAVVAHATTNGLIAVSVVAANQWQLW